MCRPTGIPGEVASLQLPTDMPSTARSTRFKLLLSTLLVLSAVLTTGTAASVFVASEPARRTAHERMAGKLEMTPHRQSAAVSALLDSLLAPLGALAPLDSVELRQVVALTQHAGREDGPTAAPVWMTTPTPVTDSLHADEMAMLRRWARSAPLPSLWGYARGLGAPSDPWALPTRAWRPLLRFTVLNEREADVALLSGDAPSAMTKARETIAAGRHFIAQPLLMDMMVGRAFVTRGAKLLARAARQGDDPFTASQARRLVELARVTYAWSHPEVMRLRTMALDPADPRLRAMASDALLPPAIRLGALDAVLSGACLRPREMLFGSTPERRAAVGALSVAVADIPRANELTPAFRRALADFDGDGARNDGGLGATRRRSRRGAMESRWAVLVPAAVRHRYTFCSGVM